MHLCNIEECCLPFGIKQVTFMYKAFSQPKKDAMVEFFPLNIHESSV